MVFPVSEYGFAEWDELPGCAVSGVKPFFGGVDGDGLVYCWDWFYLLLVVFLEVNRHWVFP